MNTPASPIVARLALLLALGLSLPAMAQDANPSAQQPAVPANTPAQPAADDEREAVLGVLDKRLRKSEFITLKPGETFTFGRISGVLRTCERTKPYEPLQSAAFVEITEHFEQPGKQKSPPPKRIFSGWLFAESPSLNSLQHPVYDVWLKSCTMHFPDGPAPASSAGGNSNSDTRMAEDAKSSE